MIFCRLKRKTEDAVKLASKKNKSDVDKVRQQMIIIAD